MIFSYNWLQSFFTKKLPAPNKLAELLTMHFAEVEEVKKKGNDFVLDIDVRPNRAGDCFSHLGIARETAAITGLKFQSPPDRGLALINKPAKDFVSVEVRDKLACPRYSAKMVTDVKVGPSPKWLKDRLEVCGLNPINNIVDIANYVMLETGQPMHAFDGKKLAGNKIIVRFAKKGEKITTLDGQKFDLDSDVLVIADAYDPVAVAGIKGGKIPEISRATKIVVLEAANFSSLIIRRASKKLNLKTDASLRFEHGLDPNLTEFAMNRAAYLIQTLASGKAAEDMVDIYPRKVYPKKIKLDLNYVKGLLGIEIPKKEIKKILISLNFKINEKTSREIKVIVPTFRLDISLPEDLIEEVGRIYGYEKISAVSPFASLIPPERNDNIFWEDMAKDILKEAGFNEVYNYSLVGKKEKELLEIENPLSSDFQYLRLSLVPGLLENIEKNKNNFKEIKIFELGKVFVSPKIEKRMLAGIITGDAFYEAKGVIELLLNKLGINQSFGEFAEIKVLPNKLTVFDIDFEKLQKFASQEKIYLPIPKFPSALRDLAVLVPRQVMVGEVLNKIKKTGGIILKDIDLFDIYQGKELPAGKKNLAFHIIYQSETKTLTSEEVEKEHQKIIKALEKEPTWQVRK